MRSKLALLLLLASCHAQDIYKQATTPYVAYRNLTWGNGAQAVNNTLWFNSLSAVNATCVSIYNNNTTNAHSFSLSVTQSSDPTTQGFTGFPKQWTPVVSPVTFPVSVPANSSISLYFSTRSAAFVALSFSGSAAAGGSPDTANIIAVEGDFSSCAASATPSPAPTTVVQSDPTLLNVTAFQPTGTLLHVVVDAGGSTVVCLLQQSVTVASATTGTLVPAPPAGQRVHVCGYVGTGARTASALASFQNGTAGACGAPGASVWDYEATTGNAANNLGSGLGQIFQTTVTGQPLCFTIGATGGTEVASVSYTVF